MTFGVSQRPWDAFCRQLAVIIPVGAGEMRAGLAKEAVIRDVGVRLEETQLPYTYASQTCRKNVSPALNAAQTQAGIAVSCYVSQPGGKDTGCSFYGLPV